MEYVKNVKREIKMSEKNKCPVTGMSKQILY